jgi:hypothetical protein
MKWISIKDKLPESCDWVLVSGKGEVAYRYTMQFARYTCGNTRKWEFIGTNSNFIETPYSDCGSGLYLDKIEYWSYLPDTPKE